MNISEIFIRRPVMTTLLMATLLIFGLVSYRSLPVSEETVTLTKGDPVAYPGTPALVL